MGPEGPQGPEGPGANQNLNTYDAVEFYGATLTNGDGENLFQSGITQIKFGYGGTAEYPHFIHTRHNASDWHNNAIDFYTNDTTADGVFPNNAVHGLTINNGSVGIAGIVDPQYALDVGGDVAGNNLVVNPDGSLYYNNGSEITEKRPNNDFRRMNTPTVAVTGGGTGCEVDINYVYGDTVYGSIVIVN
jgi:hypothetical protein